MDGNRINFR